MGIIGYDEKSGKPILMDPREFKVRYRSSLGSLEKYYKELEVGRVVAVKCKECGSKYFPPRSYCPSCGSQDLEFFVLSSRGRLITYTEINVKPQTHSKYGDYIVGVVEVDGVKVVGHVKAKFKDLRPDQNVEIKVERREGDEYPRIVFKPLD